MHVEYEFFHKRMRKQQRTVMMMHIDPNYTFHVYIVYHMHIAAQVRYRLVYR